MESVRMDILIIDDQVLSAEGLKLLLKSFKPDANFSYANNINAGLNIILEEGQPDLILLDNNQEGLSDLSIIEKLQRFDVNSPVMVVSPSQSPIAAKLALEKGIAGYVSKSCDKEILKKALDTVLQGGKYKPYHRERGYQYEDTKGLGRVTSRQSEILYLLSQGLLNKQIASELSISANTVKAHLHDIFRHLNVTNRTAAVKSAQKYGII